MMKSKDYRIPENDGEVFVAPALDEIPEAVETNRRRLNSASVQISGRPLSQLRKAARESLQDVCFASPYLPDDWMTGRPLIMTGHQPEFFHPGIWLKNLLAALIARKTGGLALNLVVDSDAPGRRGIQFPQVSGPEVSRKLLTVIENPPGVAFEELRVGHGVSLDSLEKAVSDASINEAIQDSLRAAARHLDASPGTAFAQLSSALRMKWEADLGVHNAEVFHSALSETSPFRQFMLHILADLERWQQVYNRALDDYREAHGIRSRANPLPDLAPSETPFWIWRKGEKRSAMFAEKTSSGFRLFSEGQTASLGELSCPAGDSMEQAEACLDELSRSGVRIRPRALATTAFCRVFLSDIFIHGIGGAKYDLVTDQIIQDFYELEPPVYIAASGTFRLPAEAISAAEISIDRLKYKLRDLDYNPDRYVIPEIRNRPDFTALLAEKSSLLKQMPSLKKADKFAVFLRVKALNKAMAETLVDQREQVQQLFEAARNLQGQKEILNDRSYPFFLFPLGQLREAFRKAGLEL